MKSTHKLAGIVQNTVRLLALMLHYGVNDIFYKKHAQLLDILLVIHSIHFDKDHVPLCLKQVNKHDYDQIDATLYTDVQKSLRELNGQLLNE